MTTINIPNNATNEDVLKLVFPNWEEEISTNGESIVLERFTPYCKMQLHKDWLDKPYLQNKVKESKQGEIQTIPESEITIDKNEDGIEISL